MAGSERPLAGEENVAAFCGSFFLDQHGIGSVWERCAREDTERFAFT
jgi:hypothetical protein